MKNIKFIAAGFLLAVFALLAPVISYADFTPPQYWKLVGTILSPLNSAWSVAGGGGASTTSTNTWTMLQTMNGGLVWTNATGTNSILTNITSTKAVITNLTGTNATSTNLFSTNFSATSATTTNLFSSALVTTGATSTNLFSTNFAAGTSNITNDTITNLTATNSNLTNATTTRLDLSGVANGSVLFTTSTGLVSNSFGVQYVGSQLTLGATSTVSAADSPTSTLKINGGSMSVNLDSGAKFTLYNTNSLPTSNNPEVLITYQGKSYIIVGDGNNFIWGGDSSGQGDQMYAGGALVFSSDSNGNLNAYKNLTVGSSTVNTNAIINAVATSSASVNFSALNLSGLNLMSVASSSISALVAPSTVANLGPGSLTILGTTSTPAFLQINSGGVLGGVQMVDASGTILSQLDGGELLMSNGSHSATSTLKSNSLTIGTIFSVNGSGNVSASGTFNVFGSTTLAGTTATSLTINGASVRGNLYGLTGAIGGGLLAAGGCTATVTTTVSGATQGSNVLCTPSDGTLDAAGAYCQATVTATNVVSAQVCATAAITPPSKTYNLTVFL